MKTNQASVRWIMKAGTQVTGCRWQKKFYLFPQMTRSDPQVSWSAGAKWALIAQLLADSSAAVLPQDCETMTWRGIPSESMLRVSVVGGSGRLTSGGKEGVSNLPALRVERASNNWIVVACWMNGVTTDAEEVLSIRSEGGSVISLGGGSKSLGSFFSRAGRGRTGKEADPGS